MHVPGHRQIKAIEYVGCEQYKCLYRTGATCPKVLTTARLGLKTLNRVNGIVWSED
jgi:hypothetical protein